MNAAIDLPALHNDRYGRPYLVRPLLTADRPALEAMYRAFKPKRVAQGLPPADARGIRRWLDRVLGSLADACLALPGLLLVLLLVAIAPGNFWALYVGISLVLWIEYFRLVRARTRVRVASPQLEASRLLGFGPLYLFRRHLWPELAPQVLTLAAFGAASAILAMAALGFVSVGLRPPTAELGLMMIELLPYYHEAPWAMAQPILVLFVLVMSLNLLAGRDPR